MRLLLGDFFLQNSVSIDVCLYAYVSVCVHVHLRSYICMWVIIFISNIYKIQMNSIHLFKGPVIHQALILVLLSSCHVQLLCNSKDGSLPGSSVHGIPQAIILEWVAIFLL
jgi:hypothetical protein